jgi:hypothetical protein
VRARLTGKGQQWWSMPGSGRRSVGFCMMRTASIVHCNTKRGKRGVGVAAHRRGGHGGGMSLTHDDFSGGEGSLAASRGTLR